MNRPTPRWAAFLWGAWFAGGPFGFGLAEAAAQDRVVGDDATLLEIGVLMGDQSRTFGKIDQIVVDSNGNIVVLDEQNYTVSWFAPDGRHVATTGREGEGPAEFLVPAGIAVGPNDLVYVSDAPTRRVVVFAPSSREPTILRTISVPVFADDICIAGDRGERETGLAPEARRPGYGRRTEPSQGSPGEGAHRHAEPTCRRLDQAMKNAQDDGQPFND